MHFLFLFFFFTMNQEKNEFRKLVLQTMFVDQPYSNSGNSSCCYHQPFSSVYQTNDYHTFSIHHWTLLGSLYSCIGWAWMPACSISDTSLDLWGASLWRAVFHGIFERALWWPLLLHVPCWIETCPLLTSKCPMLCARVQAWWQTWHSWCLDWLCRFTFLNMYIVWSDLWKKVQMSLGLLSWIISFALTGSLSFVNITWNLFLETISFICLGWLSFDAVWHRIKVHSRAGLLAYWSNRN